MCMECYHRYNLQSLCQLLQKIICTKNWLFCKNCNVIQLFYNCVQNLWKVSCSILVQLLAYKYFSKNLTAGAEQLLVKIFSLPVFRNNWFLRTFLNGCFSKTVSMIAKFKEEVCKFCKFEPCVKELIEIILLYLKPFPKGFLINLFPLRGCKDI